MSDLNDQHDMVRAGLRTFFRIMDAWEVDDKQAMTILGMPSNAYARWGENIDRLRLTSDQVGRLSCVLGIFKALQILIPDPVVADKWVKAKNTAPPFGGKSPLEIMTTGKAEDLIRIRRYLDAERN